MNKTNKVQGKCVCGCGGITAGFFRPGHDAKVKSWLIQEHGKVAATMIAKVGVYETFTKLGVSQIPEIDRKAERFVHDVAEFIAGLEYLETDEQRAVAAHAALRIAQHAVAA